MATVNATVSGATTYRYLLYRKEGGIFADLVTESTAIPFTFTPYPGTNTYVLVTEGNEGSCVDISGEYSLTCNTCNLSTSSPSYVCNQDGTYNASFIVLGGSGRYSFNGTPRIGIQYTVSNLSSGIHVVNVEDLVSGCTTTVSLSQTCQTNSCEFVTADSGAFTVSRVVNFTATGATRFNIGLTSVSIPDRIIIRKNGLPHFDSGCFGYSSSCLNNAHCINALGEKGYAFNIAAGEHIEIFLDATCSQNSGTCWGFKALCNNNQIPFTVSAGTCNSNPLISTFQDITLTPLTRTFPTLFTNVVQEVLGAERYIKFNNSNDPAIGRIPEYGIVYENVQSATQPSEWGFVYSNFTRVLPSTTIKTSPNTSGGLTIAGAFTGFTLWVRDYLDHTAIQSAHYTFI
jgi:hypothetical protein